MTQAVRNLYYDLHDDLDRIAKRFKRCKVTLIVRNLDVSDGDVVIGDDDPESAIAAIRRLQDKTPVGSPVNIPCWRYHETGEESASCEICRGTGYVV